MKQKMLWVLSSQSISAFREKVNAWYKACAEQGHEIVSETYSTSTESNYGNDVKLYPTLTCYTVFMVYYEGVHAQPGEHQRICR